MDKTFPPSNEEIKAKAFAALPSKDMTTNLREYIKEKEIQWFETIPGDQGYSKTGQVVIPAESVNGKGRIVVISEADIADLLQAHAREAVKRAIAVVDDLVISENRKWKLHVVDVKKKDLAWETAYHDGILDGYYLTRRRLAALQGRGDK